MNKTRLKRITKIHEELTLILEEEETAKENIPYNLQCSQSAERMDNAIENLTNAIDSLESILEV